MMRPRRSADGSVICSLIRMDSFSMCSFIQPLSPIDKGPNCLLSPLKEVFPRLCLIWADSGYAGKLEEWVKNTLGWTLEIVKRLFEGVRYVWVPSGVEPPA